jgi:hypothetical protein
LLGPATSFCASWFKKQSHTIEEQLRDGIRYLQFRIIKHTDGALYVTNKLLGPKIEEVLEEVKAFVMHNREEIVMLDFFKFFGMDKEAHVAFKELLFQVFSGLLVPRMRGPRVTPNQLWNLKVCFILISNYFYFTHSFAFALLRFGSFFIFLFVFFYHFCASFSFFPADVLGIRPGHLR